MPTAREWTQLDQDRADADLIREAADHLCGSAARGWAGVQLDVTAAAVADLLYVLADEVSTLDPGTRRQVVQSCRTVLGRTMDNPTTRRTRRR